MKSSLCVQYAMATIASLGFVLPSGVLAADAGRTPLPTSASPAPSVLDISLGDEGTLTGQVLNAQGVPLAQANVTVRRSGTAVATAVTDSLGSFAVHGLQGGVCEVTAAGGSGVFRLWTGNASPPSAHKGVLIVANEPVARGQFFSGRSTNGQAVVIALLGAGLGAGIAAIATSGDEHKSGS